MGEERKGGSLFEDFEPAFNPPDTIPDPTDSKPADWVDEPKIADPDASKPEDWDEDAPETIPDEDATVGAREGERRCGFWRLPGCPR